MTYALQMATTRRHNSLIGEMYLALTYLLKTRTYEAMHEEQALVYYGKLYDICTLVDINSINKEDVVSFQDKTIDTLAFVQPDFMLFKKGSYLLNPSETKVAGIPELIVEVWSLANRQEERTLKKKLYSSANTEHWYITQDSNLVECCFGERSIGNQSLTEVLKTTRGVELDLRYLAL